ncbi:hypothetical protein, partial [Pseudomonas alvandae]|uniref:hypothetical protein n=1 Tax=Pseudomonas canavaninivorans TaxID=2842348 RepID=UPI002B1E5C52
NYSGAMLLVGYLASVGVTFLLGYFGQRAAPKRMYFVPDGNIDIVTDAADIEWVRLDSPVVPEDPNVSIVADLRTTHSPEWERMLA